MKKSLDLKPADGHQRHRATSYNRNLWLSQIDGINKRPKPVDKLLTVFFFMLLVATLVTVIKIASNG